MAVDIGPKIGIDGEKEYRDELQKIIQKSKTLATEMDVVTSSFTKETSEKKKSAEYGKVLSEQIKTQSERVKLLSDMVKRSTEATGSESTATQKWQQALNEATAELNKMQDESGHVDEAVKKLGNEHEDGATHAKTWKESLQDAVAQKVVDGIKSACSTMASAVKSLASSMASTFSETVTWADDLATLSTQTGLSTETLQEYQYTAELTDTSVETITGSLTKLARNMNTARDGSGDAAEAFKQLNISITDENGALRDNEVVFGEALDALAAMEEGTERDALAMTLFGRSAQDLNPLIAVGADGMAELAEEAHEMGYVLSEDAVSGLIEVSDSMERITNATDSMKRNLSASFAPVVEMLADDVVPALSDVAGSLANVLAGEEDFDSFFAKIVDGVNDVISEIKNLGPSIVKQGGNIVSKLIEGVNTALPQLAPMALDLVMSVVDSIMTNLPQMVQTGTEVVMSLIEGIGNALPELIPAAVDCVNQISKSMASSKSIGSIIKAVIAIIEGFVDGIGDALPMIIEATPEIIIALVTGLIENLPTLVASVPKIIEGFVKGIVNCLPAIANAGNTILDKLSDVISNPSGLISAGKATIDSFVNGVKSAWSNITTVASQAWSKFKEALYKPNLVKEWGVDMIKKLVEGIKSMINKVKESVQNVANVIKQWLHFSLPDKGPLRKVPEWGADMVKEFVGGIESAESTLNSKMGTLSGKMAALASGGSVSNYGGVSINVYGADGQDMSSLADQIMVKMQTAVNRREAVFA